MLDVFQSLQKKNIPFMLVLVGLPTLFPKLVEARTFAERMFHVVFLKRLDERDSRDAILKPIKDAKCRSSSTRSRFGSSSMFRGAIPIVFGTPFVVASGGYEGDS